MKHRKGRDSISDLNAAATLPATRTNEPRSHVLLFYSVLLELKQLESFRLVSVSFIVSIEQEKNEFFMSLSNTWLTLIRILISCQRLLHFVSTRIQLENVHDNLPKKCLNLDFFISLDVFTNPNYSIKWLFQYCTK